MRPSRAARGAALLLAAVAAAPRLPAGTAPREAGGRSPAGSPRPLLGVSVNATCGWPGAGSEGDVILDLAARGMRLYAVSADWAQLESDPSVGELIRWAVPWLHGHGMEVLLTIPTLDTVIRTMPPDLLDRPMDDPGVMARFDAVLAALLTPEVAGSLAWLSVGNEVDGYLSDHPDELDAFVRFAAHAYATARGLGFTGGVGVTLQREGLVADPHGIARRLLEDADTAIVTYYPMREGFVFRDPREAPADLAGIVRAARGLPVVLQEVGYATDPSIGGGEARQATFLATVLAAARALPAIRAVNVEWLCDMDRATAEALARDRYAFPPGAPGFDAFVAYLTSIGLWREGAPKAGWPVLERALAAGAPGPAPG